MKKLVFLSALALVVGAGLLRLLQHDAGYVLIVAWGKTIEMRVVVALLLLLVIAAGGALALFSLGKSVRFVRQRLVSSRAARASKRQKRLDQAVLHFLAGDWALSKKLALQASKADKKTSFPLLLAARCANNLSDQVESLFHIEKAEAIKKGDANKADEQVALLLLKAEVLFDQNKFAPCLMVLNQAKTLAPTSPALLDLLRRAYEATQDWNALDGLIPELERAKVYSDAQLTTVKESLYFSRLGAFGFQVESTEGDEKSSLKGEVEEYWRRLPKLVKQSPKFIERYCQLLILIGATSKAEALIRASLKSSWSHALVLLYGLLQSEDKKGQLKAASTWLQAHPNDASLQLTLGRLCVRNELWGSAREHFQASIATAPSSVAFVELAGLLASLGEEEGSKSTYKQGLVQATQGLPNLPAVQQGS